MDSTHPPQARQRPCVANYPATPADIERIREKWLHLLFHHGRPIETIGETLLRRMNGVPDPLPDVFVARLAATIAARPVFFGRLVRHALRSAGEVDGG